MKETYLLTKSDVAERYNLSKKAIDTACSRNPDSLPRFFKLGASKNSPIRFRLEDCLDFEREMLNRQVDALKQKQREEQMDLSNLEDFLP
ncbi:MAG TPA: hypothetical protein VIM93_00200 [Kangiella sp.]